MSRPPVRRLGGDAALVVVSRLIPALALVALTPVLLDGLGKPAYGVWVIVSAATGLVGLVDVGIAPAVSRVVAACAARGDDAGIRAAVGTAVLTSLALDVPLLAAGWLLAPLVAGRLAVPDALQDPTAQALRLACLAFAVTTLAAVLEGALIGRRRFRGLLAMRLLALGVFVAGAIATVRTGRGVVALASCQVAAMALSSIIGIVLCRAIVAPRRGPLVRRASLRELLRFGLPQQASRIAYAGAMHYERILVGVLIGAVAAAEYGVASAVVAALCSLLAQAAIVLVPALTQVHVRDPEQLPAAWRRASASFGAIAAGAFALLAATAAPLVVAWLGHGFGATVRAIQLLAVGYALWAIVQPGFALAQSLGRPALEARAAAIVIAADLAGATALLALVGAPAIGVGTSAALTLGALGFWRVAPGRIAILRGCALAWAPPVACAALPAALVALANGALVPLDELGRLPALSLAVGEAALLALVYAAGLLHFGVLPRTSFARWLRLPGAAAADPEAARAR